MNTNINESLNISLSNSEISNSNSNISSKNKISLKDLLKIALTELDSEINSFNRKNTPISDIKEIITIQTTKKFISCDDGNNTIKLISFNTKESNRNMIKYNIDSLKTIISKVNKTLTRYYGSLIIEPIRKEYSGYISLKYLGRVENLKENITLFDEAYLSNELEYMYLEEKEFMKEVNNLLNENSDVLDKKYKLPNQKGKNFVNGKDDEKEKLSTRKLIKSIYNLKDDDFVEGKFFPLFTKALVRVVGFIAITASAYAIANKAIKTKSVDSETKEKKGEEYTKKKMEQYKKFKQAKVVAITLFTAMSAYVINRSLKKNMRDAQRKRLLDFYENKIEYIDNKIESATTNEEKYELKKLRTTLVRDSEKIKVFASNSNPSNK